jgi:ribA/ribD-fused uncharacterized protein
MAGYTASLRQSVLSFTTTAKKAKHEVAEVTHHLTRVVRLRRRGGVVTQDCDVYIGRACTRGGWNLPESKWHNPYSVAQTGSAEEAVRLFGVYLAKNKTLMAMIPELKGKVLGCWCTDTPSSPCHGDVLALVANSLASAAPTSDLKETKEEALAAWAPYKPKDPGTVATGGGGDHDATDVMVAMDESCDDGKEEQKKCTVPLFDESVKPIDFYDQKEDPYGVFSNFALSAMVVDETEYTCCEQFYQASKFVDPEYRAEIMKQKTGGCIKYLSDQNPNIVRWPWQRPLALIVTKHWERGVRMREGWKDMKLDVMRKGVMAKFKQNQSMRRVLLSTGNALLREASPRDSFWGTGKNGDGQNWLGRILMEVRYALSHKE